LKVEVITIFPGLDIRKSYQLTVLPPNAAAQWSATHCSGPVAGFLFGIAASEQLGVDPRSAWFWWCPAINPKLLNDCIRRVHNQPLVLVNSNATRTVIFYDFTSHFFSRQCAPDTPRIGEPECGCSFRTDLGEPHLNPLSIQGPQRYWLESRREPIASQVE
jgi:hypothetical protein